MIRASLVMILAAGCSVTGNNYPERYASAFCASLFECMADDDEIEFIFGYDDEPECRERVASDIRNDSSYDAFEEGDRVYDPDAGEACLEEVAQLRQDSDCGSMSWITFGIDALSEECFNVFPKADD